MNDIAALAALAAQAADLARCLAAILIPLALALTFITMPGGRWFGLRRCRPRSEHWGISLPLNGGLALAATLLLWPDAPGQGPALGVVLLLFGGELFLRLRPPAPNPRIKLPAGENLYNSRLYRPHHYTLFEPRPDIRTDRGTVHNRFGFRDPRPLGPDADAIRIVFLGGPTVYGVMTDDDAQLFTRLLEQRLNETFRDRLQNRHFEVINAGMANATSNEMLLRQIFAVSEVHPALVAIQAGICDTWPRVASDDYFGDYRQMRKRWGHGRLLHPRISVADSLVRALIWRSALLSRWLGDHVPAEPLLEMTNHNNSGQRARLAANPPVYFERNLRYMLALNREMGAHSLLIGDQVPVGPNPDGLYQRAVPEHNAVMARLAKTQGTPFLDLAAALPLTDEIREADKYLNAAGQQRLADLLFDFLRAERVIEEMLRGGGAR